MPGMDGNQVLEVLKTYGRTKDIPIIAVTANAIPRDLEKGGASGLDAYITKPLDVPKFMATVDHFLAKPARPTERKFEKVYNLYIQIKETIC